MKKSVILLICLVVVGSFMGCTTFKVSGLHMDKNSPSYQTVGEFDIVVPVLEFLGAPGGANLLNVTADAMDTKIFDAVQREIGKFSGDAAVNITIEYRATPLDLIIGGITSAIIAPAHAYISGTIIKYQ